MPVPGVEVRLVDADGEDALVGDAGEIWVRGPNVFQGYWNDREATRPALTDDGWLRTGDIAVVDDDGYLYLVDRAKDLIIVSGFNVFPAEVEEVLLEHPARRGCRRRRRGPPALGRGGEGVRRREPGASVEEDDIIEFCAGQLARYKCPAKVMFVDELPAEPLRQGPAPRAAVALLPRSQRSGALRPAWHLGPGDAGSGATRLAWRGRVGRDGSRLHVRRRRARRPGVRPSW